MNKIKPSDILRSSKSNATHIYETTLNNSEDVQLVVLLAGCFCNEPIDNYPFKEPVFAWLKEISEYIVKYSNRFSIPPIAVAGALADEYNTRFMPDYSLEKKTLDNLQDKVYPKGKYTEFPEEINNKLSSEELERQYVDIKNKDPNNLNRTTWDRVSNAVAGDYGKGNISLRTAYDAYDQKIDNFPKLSRLDILRYLVTDEGTVHFAAISIKLAKIAMSNYIKELPPRKKEAILVTYFKQGDNYRLKYINQSLKQNPKARIRSGEGCRTCFQRKKIADIIGVEIKVLEGMD